MATQSFNTRIMQKYDEYLQWIGNDPVLLRGEIATVYVPEGTGHAVTEPTLLMKVGDGEKKFSELPWLSAPASDVHEWAKAANKPQYEAKEITGIGDYIAQYVDETLGISVDTDTQYRINKTDDYTYVLQSKGKGEDDAAFVTVSTIAIPKYDDTQVNANIAALQELVGETAVATQIADAIAALDLANTYEAKGEAAKVQEALEAYQEANDGVIAGIKNGETINDFKAVEDALAAVGGDVEEILEDYATKEEAQGYADAKDEAIAAAKKAGDDAQAAVDTLAGKVGEVPSDKTVVQMISEAQTAATYDDTEVKEDIQANAEAIALLNNGAAVEGSVDYKIAQAVAAIMENPDETMNSINELVTWVNDHADDALALSNQVSANKGDIEALQGLVGSTDVAEQITDAIAAALTIEGVDKYALATDLTAAIGRIAAMEAKVATWDAAEQNAKDYADGLNTAMDTRMQVVEGKAHEHTFNETELNKVQEGDVDKWNAAQANAEATAAAALDGAKTELEGKIADAQAAAEKVANDNNTAMDNRVKVLEEIDHDAYIAADEQVLTGAKDYTDEKVGELDGELAAIAKTGNIADLIQTEGDCIIFNCGTASTVMNVPAAE